MKSIKLHICSLISFTLLASTVLLSCTDADTVKKNATDLMNRKDCKGAMKELVKLSDSELLESDELMEMLATAYYATTMQVTPNIAGKGASAALSSSGEMIAVNDTSNKTVYIYQYPDMKLQKTITMPGVAHGMAFNPDGKSIAVALADKTVKIFDVKTGEMQKSLSGHTYTVRDVVYKDPEHLYSTSVDCTVAEWKLPEGKMLWREKVHKIASKDLSLSKDKSMIATAGNDGTSTFFPTTDESPGPKPPFVKASTGHINAVEFSTDNKSVYTGDQYGVVYKWNTDAKGDLPKTEVGDMVTDLCLTNDGNALLVATINSVLLLDPQTLKTIARIDNYDGFTNTVMILPDGDIGFADKKKFVHAKPLYGQELIDEVRKIAEGEK